MPCDFELDDVSASKYSLLLYRQHGAAPLVRECILNTRSNLHAGWKPIKTYSSSSQQPRDLPLAVSSIRTRWTNWAYVSQYVYECSFSASSSIDFISPYAFACAPSPGNCGEITSTFADQSGLDLRRNPSSDISEHLRDLSAPCPRSGAQRGAIMRVRATPRRAERSSLDSRGPHWSVRRPTRDHRDHEIRLLVKPVMSPECPTARCSLIFITPAKSVSADVAVV